MKILFVHPSVELYGADKILLYILKMLCKKHQLTVLLPKDGILIEHIRDISLEIKVKIFNDLPIVHSKLKLADYIKLPFKILKSHSFLKNERFDYCFCNTLATILLLFAGFSKNRVLYVHEIISSKFLNLGFSILAKIGANKIVCVSNHVKNNLLFSKKYIVIHNGIPDIADGFLKNEIHPDGKIKFVLPGRFMPQKGQWFLIDTLSKFSDEYKNKIQVDLYGSVPPFKPELLNELKRKIESFGLDKLIFLHSFTQNISDIYKDSNVVLVPSLMADPFPTTVLEALMFSRPVIATNHGGASEILDDSFSKIIAPNDIDSFCDAIKFFVDNKNLIKEYSRNAREKFSSYLIFEKYQERFFSIFKELK